ncbi:MAG: hypothetical protein OXU64_12565 [Gemmatimonadota bacterium]|nr:hypothetical protein [Gemmatimonadota bacterium]
MNDARIRKLADQILRMRGFVAAGYSPEEQRRARLRKGKCILCMTYCNVAFTV